MAPKRKRSPSIVFVRYVRTAPAPFNKPDDFNIRTVQDTQYHVSHAILSFASLYFHDLPCNPPDARDPFVLNVLESDATLEILLRFTYPVPDPVLCDLDDITDAYVAAKKYQLNGAVDGLRRALVLPRFLDREPVRVYAIVRRFGLVQEANLAADAACASSPADWPICEEFEHTGGMAYQDLVLYHRRRAAAAADVLKKPDLFNARHICTSYRTRSSAPYVSAIEPLLAHAPLREDIFTASFLTGVGTKVTSYDTCTVVLVRATDPGGAIHRLKMQLRAVSLHAVEASVEGK